MCSHLRLLRLSLCGSMLLLSRCVVDNFYLWYCVEGVIVCHEGTDTLAEFTELDADIPQEGATCPLSHDHDCLWIHFGQIDFHVKPRPYGVGAHLFV